MILKDQLDSFTRGMKEASEAITEIDPDYLIAPMMGAVPFIDAMHIINEDLDINSVHYMPASSHVEDTLKSMRDWADNFLEQNIQTNKPATLMTIDEVVSGSSTIRVNRTIQQAIRKKKRDLTSQVLSSFYTNDPKGFQKAAEAFGQLSDNEHYGFLSQILDEQRQGRYQTDPAFGKQRRNELANTVKKHFEEHITYIGIGIEDAKMEAQDKKRRGEYIDLVYSKKVIPVRVSKILTMDKPELCPAKYKQIGNNKTYVRFAPIVENFVVTDKYLALLSSIAKIAGKNPEQVAPINMNRILESSKYLSPQTKNRYEKHNQ